MVDVATGSLGQGLPIGVGVALTGQRLDRLPYRVWVLCGDSEMAEGSIWEAFEHAAYAGLDNLIAILDINRLGQRGETMHGWNLRNYAGRVEAFGWHAIEIDGHDVDGDRPRLRRGRGDHGQADRDHRQDRQGQGRRGGRGQERAGTASRSTTPRRRSRSSAASATCTSTWPSPSRTARRTSSRPAAPSLPAYELGDKVATRKAYGDALAALGAMHGDVVALDGEVGNSTYAEIFSEAHPDRYFEMFIAEQQMVAAAVGMQVRGWKPFASTFAAFLTRAYDFIRMAAISRADLRLSGSHAGVSIGEDGPSQMAPGGPGDVARRPRQHRALPERRQPDRRSSSRRWPTATASPTCAPRAASTPVIYGARRPVPDRRLARRARVRRATR